MTLKLWLYRTHRQLNAVCAPSKKRAVELLNENGHNVSLYSFNDFASSPGSDWVDRFGQREGLWVGPDMGTADGGGWEQKV